MTTALVGVILLALAALNARAARSILYPPAIFAAYWAFLLLAISTTGDAFSPIELPTLMIYIVGTFAFSAGGLLSLVVFKCHTSPLTSLSERRRVAIGRFLDVGLILLVTLFPFYWSRVQDLSSAADEAANFWVGVRYQTSVIGGGEGFGVFAYVRTFATFLALASFYEHDRSRGKSYRMVALILLALVYQVLSTARTGAMILLFGLVGISWMKSGKLRARSALAGGGVALIVFAILGILLRKGGRAEADIGTNIYSIFGSLQLYLLGGPVAFGQYVQDLVYLEPGPRTLRFFWTIFNAFGASTSIPSLVLSYTHVPAPTNVYTIYLPFYSDFGLPGVVILMFAIGSFATWIFQQARRSHHPFVILYGVLIASIVLTTANDTFFTALSYWIQMAFYAVVLYYFPLVRHGDDSRRSPESERHSSALATGSGLQRVPHR
jgi:oligosaccharide repeat unit polymerase